MSKKTRALVIALIAIVVLVVIFAVVMPWVWKSTSGNGSTVLNSFAQCLAQKGIVMYGTYYCSHCQEQKAMFGASFKYVNYVECTQNVNKCLAENVTSTPTWVYPNGERYVGTQSIQNLANESGCILPAATNSAST